MSLLPKWIWDQDVRAVLSFFGGGIVVVVGGIWAVYVHFHPTPPPGVSPSSEAAKAICLNTAQDFVVKLDHNQISVPQPPDLAWFKEQSGYSSVCKAPKCTVCDNLRLPTGQCAQAYIQNEYAASLNRYKWTNGCAPGSVHAGGNPSAECAPGKVPAWVFSRATFATTCSDVF